MTKLGNILFLACHWHIFKRGRSTHLLNKNKKQNNNNNTNDSRKEIIHCPRYDHVHWHGFRSRLQQLTN
jgi:hypothetical protein